MSSLPAHAVNPPLRPTTTRELWDGLHAHHPTLSRARHLGEALQQSGLVGRATIESALAHQQKQRRNAPPGDYPDKTLLGQILVRNGVLSEAQLQAAIAAWLGDPVIDPRQLSPDPSALALVPRHVAERESVLPLLLEDEVLVLLMADPWDQRLLDELRFLTQHRLLPALAAPGTLQPTIARFYPRQSGPTASPPGTSAPGEAPKALDARALANELAPVSDTEAHTDADQVNESDNTLVRLINTLISEAQAHRASDIHIEMQPAPAPVRIRLRVDGRLINYLEVPCHWRFALVTRLKIMAGLDISEHRKPQDGKIDFSRFGNSRLEMRMVTVPTSQGLEDVVLRLLGSHRPLPLDSIGLNPDNLQALRTVAQKSYGLVLVCGPTGSGKTTTLHSLIRDINTEDRKIWTAEDPVEITQEGLRQVQINPRIGWTFAAAMRTFLRADPDVIMIGEMRDEETARIAVEASLTGHLVLSTLHTNSAPESVGRLLEIGLDPFNFSDSLLAILAQRLVRRLCPQCREARPATPEALHALARQYLQSASDGSTPPSADDVQHQVARWQHSHGQGPQGLMLYRAHEAGCPHCEHHGYLGRLGLHELMLSNDTIRSQIRHRASGSELRQSALAAGMKTLRQDGIEKMLQGLTDLNEVLAATNL
ncbi:MAG: type II/IV secretion system protein [Curvibacter sp.]|nr:MAG: type II/IV secretion system protein [Curvibacter sp.]